MATVAQPQNYDVLSTAFGKFGSSLPSFLFQKHQALTLLLIKKKHYDRYRTVFLMKMS